MQGEGPGDDCVFELWGGSGGDEGLARGAGGGVFEFVDLAVEERYWCLRGFCLDVWQYDFTILDRLS